MTLLQLGSTSVLRGSVVAEGDVVGAVGESADEVTSAPHVHLGVRVATDPDGYVDPLGLLPALAPPPVPAPPPPVPEPQPPTPPVVSLLPSRPRPIRSSSRPARARALVRRARAAGAAVAPESTPSLLVSKGASRPRWPRRRFGRRRAAACRRARPAECCGGRHGRAGRACTHGKSRHARRPRLSRTRAPQPLRRSRARSRSRLDCACRGCLSPRGATRCRSSSRTARARRARGSSGLASSASTRARCRSAGCSRRSGRVRPPASSGPRRARSYHGRR